MRRLPIPSSLSCLVGLVLVGAGCPDPTPASIQRQCERDPDAECCGNADCGPDQICDFDYVCGLTAPGIVTCGEPGGDRTCHDLCDPAVGCDDATLECTEVSQAQDGDAYVTYEACS